ncbi:MAG: LPS-assembly protein LptD, partial [Alistipes sp.]|nr:LPS-assembly protein LptD [Alistipes sp.]
MNGLKSKYLASALLVLLFAQAVLGGSTPHGLDAPEGQDTALRIAAATADSAAAALSGQLIDPSLSRTERRSARRTAREQARNRAAFDALPQEERDSLFSAQVDSLVAERSQPDSTRSGSAPEPREPGAFLDDPISGKNTDSLVYDVRNKLVYIYNEGDVSYQSSNLKADYMRIDMNDKMIYAYGKADSLDGKPIVTKPEFTEGGDTFQMDTITYNLDSKKAKIKGVATQQGDGWLVGGSVKKMADNTINIEHGKYTTCDETDHPHFYLAMTKAKVIPGKKVVTGPAYLVLEDVPLYPLMI